MKILGMNKIYENTYIVQISEYCGWNYKDEFKTLEEACQYMKECMEEYPKHYFRIKEITETYFEF